MTEFVYRYTSSKRAFIFLSFYLSSSSSTSRAVPPQTGAGGSGASTPVATPAELRQSELSSILSTLQQGGMSALDISDNELAKSHARYLVGGKTKVADERMFRFEFPERPGALRKFLETLGGKFNISLFHYRNHGGGALPFSTALSALCTPADPLPGSYADVGKILCGLQVPEGTTAAFEEWLNSLKYPYVEETQNPAYADFLGEEDAE